MIEKEKYHPLATVMDEKHSNLFELMKWMSDYYYEDPVLNEHLAQTSLLEITYSEKSLYHLKIMKWFKYKNFLKTQRMNQTV